MTTVTPALDTGVDTMNYTMKLQILDDLKILASTVADKVDILAALDQDRSDSGRYDLMDQLVTFKEAIDTLQKVTLRSIAIVPGGS
jgi:hypothetical protein